MYKLTYDVEECDISECLEFENLSDFYEECDIYQEVERYNLADLFDKVGYGINIFKSIPNKNDYFLIYTSSTFWDVFEENLHTYILGRLFSECFPKLCNSGAFVLNKVYHDTNNRLNAFLRLYEDDKLLKVWSQINIKHEDLIYCCMQDETEYYLEKEKEKQIFKNIAYPILDVYPNSKVSQVNNAFHELLGYTADDLNIIGLDEIVNDFYSDNINVKNFSEAIKLIYEEKLSPQNYETLLITKNMGYKWFNAHIRLVDDEILQISLQDISELKESQKNSINLSEYLADMEETSSTAFDIRTEEGFHWTDEIYNILEVDEEERVYFTKENIIFNYIAKENREKIREDIDKLSLNNPVNLFYDVKTAKGNQKYLKALIKIKKEENRILRLGFTKDITEKYIAEKEALELQENLNIIGEFSKIVIGTLQDGEFKFTSEIYNILGVSPDDYSDTDLLSFVLPEDRKMIMDYVNNVSPENPNFKYIYRLKTPNDDIKYMSTFNKAIFDDNGVLDKVIGFQQDITEQILVEEEAMRLQTNMELVQGLTKIFLGEIKEGEYFFTSEVYNILGVKPEDFSASSFVEDFVVKDDQILIKNLLNNLTIEKPYNNIIFRVKTGTGEIRYLSNYTRASFQDGELYNIVGFFQDITEETLTKKEAVELQNSLNSISDLSKIVISSYENGEYTWTSEIYKILKIKPSDYSCNVNLLDNFIVPEDREFYYEALSNFTPLNNTFSKIIKLYDNDGDVKFLNSNVVADFNSENEIKSLHCFIQDVTEETLAKAEAVTLKENLETIQKTSKIVIANYKDGKFSWTSEIYNILEIDSKEYPPDIDLLELFVFPEDKGVFDEKVETITPDNPHLHNVTRIKTCNGNVKYLEAFIESKFNDDGELVEFVEFIHEITDIVKRERKLEQLSEDRKILLQEVHHRVKNNLQLILSFLSLETRFNRDDPEYVIEQTRNRIRTMALTHEEVYKSPTVSKVNLQSFLQSGMTSLFNLYTQNKIKLHFDIEPIEVDIDKSIPLGLMVNELALNTIKYAFPETGEGNFYIDLKMDEDLIILKVWDDGVGLPSNVDLVSSNGLGFVIVRNLTQQLEAELNQLENINGFGIQLVFHK